MHPRVSLSTNMTSQMAFRSGPVQCKAGHTYPKSALLGRPNLLQGTTYLWPSLPPASARVQRADALLLRRQECKDSQAPHPCSSQLGESQRCRRESCSCNGSSFKALWALGHEVTGPILSAGQQGPLNNPQKLVANVIRQIAVADCCN